MYYLFYLFLLYLEGTVHLNPNNANWSVFNDDYQEYYLEKGDYEDQGRLIITGKSNFLIAGDSSVIRQIELINCENVVISGVALRGTTFFRQCANITIKSSYLWPYQGAGLRIIESDSVLVLNNHIETAKRPTNDAVVGILVQGVSRWNRYSGNTIVNHIDGIGLSETKNAIDDFTGTIIENNNIYIDHRVRETINGQEFAITENAIDIKNASLDPSIPVIIRNNKLHGHRWSRKGTASGSAGEEIVIHRSAKNILIENNLIYDGVGGVRVGPTIVDGKWFYPNNRNVTIRGNTFENIYKRDSLSRGVIYYIASETIIEGNIENSYTDLLHNVHVETEIK